MLAKRLKQLRLDKNVNQCDLAAFLGVSQSTIGRWETGKRTPDLTMLSRLAHYFSVTTDYLLGDDEVGGENEAFPFLARRLAGIPESERSAILGELSATVELYLKQKGL